MKRCFPVYDFHNLIYLIYRSAINPRSKPNSNLSIAGTCPSSDSAVSAQLSRFPFPRQLSKHEHCIRSERKCSDAPAFAKCKSNPFQIPPLRYKAENHPRITSLACPTPGGKRRSIRMGLGWQTKALLITNWRCRFAFSFPRGKHCTALEQQENA